jgi:hypothetical protein
MAPDHETVACRYLLLQFFDGLVLELDDRVTPRANQVVMVLTGQRVLIAGLTVMQQDLAGQTRLGEQLEGTVDRGVADAGMAGLNLQVQFFDTDVLVGGKKEIENDVPLTRGTETLGRSKLVECPFLFEDHPAPLLNLKFNIRTTYNFVNSKIELSAMEANFQDAATTAAAKRAGITT